MGRDKVIEVPNPNDLDMIHYTELNDFQGDLKVTTREKLNKLKNSIIEHGVFKSKTVWADSDDRLWILDGHRTKEAIIELIDEGWQIGNEPDEGKIPVEYVEADSKEEAVKKFLQLLSEYGKINERTDFFEDLKDVIEIDDSIFDDIEIPEYDEVWVDEFFNVEDDDEGFSDSKAEEEDEESEIETEFGCKAGALWYLEGSLLYCGDALDLQEIIDEVAQLETGFNIANIDMLFFDPPYQLDYDEQKDILVESLRHSHDTAVLMASRRTMNRVYGDFDKCDTPIDINYRHDLVWDRVNPHLGASLQRPLAYHVPMDVYGVGESKVFNRDNTAVEQVFNGLDRIPSILRIPDKKRYDDLLQRGAKPLDLLRVLIGTYCVSRVLDPCAGNGTTLVAGYMERRQVLAIEKNPAMCNVALEYFKRETGKTPEKIN